MNTQKVLECLGKPLSDLQTLETLKTIGVDSPESMQVPEGEYSEYFISKPSGFSLIFSDEAMFLGKPHQQVGDGPLYFSGVFFYAGGKDGYSSYTGELPLGITFNSSREQLIKLLGGPSWERQNSRGGAGADRWDDKAKYRIHITYNGEGKPEVISCHIPNAA